MREILFRGKRKDNGRWVEGRLLADDVIVPKGQELEVEGGWLNANNLSAYIVNPETVGQYTGLTDADGNRIFEGDIVTSVYLFEKGKSENSVIEYGEWNCSCCNGVFGWVSNGYVDFRDYDVIVIGNIHDNPELLKGGEG